MPPSTASVITGIIAARTPKVAICWVRKRPRYSKKKSAISTTTIVADTTTIGAIAWKSQPGFMDRVLTPLGRLMRRRPA